MEATITLDKDFAIGTVDPRLFGGFAEHLGRHIYEGIYEPDHPDADEDGFRRDVMDLVRDLKMPVMRYPGGNFVSGYNWEDGVGPIEQRPAKLDLAWMTTESNHFGTNEFMRWCKKIGTAPMMAVNLGTRGPDEARNLLEYCNHPSGSYWSDLRRSHGYEEPHKVKLWCLGNEMDGKWQICSKTATEYGRIAAETAKLMKWTDPTIELIACGSSGRTMSTFGAWELEVLDQTFSHVDYVSLHTYYGNSDNNTKLFLSQPENMGDFIDETVALCDAVAAKKKSRKRIMLSFDEWNVWFHTNISDRKMKKWQQAPHRLEDVYTMEDALVVGGMLIQLLNHCDRVKIACIAQVVNVIAPIMTAKGGAAWKQTIYYPLMQASRKGRGTVLRGVVDSPHYKAGTRDNVPYLSSSVVWNERAGTLTVFALNRSLDTPLDLTVALRAFPELRVQEWVTLRHDNLKATNTMEAPDTVVPAKVKGATVGDGALTAQLAPASWNVITLK